ncbi:MAG: branched-chain amino acid ABC transporter permease [Longimicrobiales bacterium]|nr:branched-chain amino acid ABC transporter permease [Longimicrobiales bacterium]
MSLSRISKVATGILLLAAILFPLMASGNRYLVSVVVTAYVTGIAVYGLDVLLGYTGQLSLAHAGFFAVGGYTTALLMRELELSFWLALPAALLLTCVLGYLIGLAALRTREDYFAIFTLAVGVMIVIVIDRWEGLTGGTDGLIGIPSPSPLGPITFETLTSQYYLILLFLILTIYAVWALVNSLVGRTFIAVRNSEELARAMGIDTGRTHQLAFVISVALAALGGSLYAVFQGYIGPDMGGTLMTFMMLTYLMVGGVASLVGPLLGTLLVTALMQGLQAFEAYQMMVLGPILAVVIIFFPHGLAGRGRHLVEKWAAEKRAPRARSGSVEEG